jgi:hypothetical protein
MERIQTKKFYNNTTIPRSFVPLFLFYTENLSAAAITARYLFRDLM